MSILEWKKINLFNLIPFGDYGKLKNIKSNITAQCHNDHHIVLCDSNGWIHVFFRNWEHISFKSESNNIKLCTITSKGSVLITLQQEESSNELSLHIFNLENLTKRNGAPCSGVAHLRVISHASCLRAFTTDSHICIAIGFERGDIFLYRGAVLRDISANFRCFAASIRTITGIEFIESTATFFMYVCSDAGVVCYGFNENNSESKLVLDANMSPTPCCSLYQGEQAYFFMVGRDDAVYCYTTEGRGPCYAIEGKKRFITRYGNNLVVVIHNISLSPNVLSQIIVIDLHNKIIVLNKYMDMISNIIVQNGSCYVFTNSMEVFVLRERELQNKLRLLAQRNLYDIAIRLLENSDGDEQSLAHIYIQYGNYLLLKGDIHEAVNKYIKTIGIVEPYCIIRNLLDPRHSKYLKQYLSAFVQSKWVNDEYLELYSNCQELQDLSTNIDNLCDKMQDSTKYFDILSMQNKNLNDVVVPNINLTIFLKHVTSSQAELYKYFINCSENDIYYFFMENMNLLMAKHPTETVDILKLICTKSSIGRKLCTSPEQFIPLLIKYHNYCIDFLKCITHDDKNCSKTFYNLLIELYLQSWRNGTKTTEEVLSLIREFNVHFIDDYVYISCRNYSFWPGIIYLYISSKQSFLCFRYFVKTSDYKNALISVDQCSNQSLSMYLIRTLNKNELMSSDLTNYLLHAMIQDKDQSFLQIMQTISANKNFLVLHIKEFITQKHLKATTELKYNTQILKLYEDMKSLNNLILRFPTRPIEFRSSTCDLCRQQLKLPSVYFLCQHSFHKDCISAYSENQVCVVCMTHQKRDNLQQLDLEKKLMEKLSCMTSHNLLNIISTILCLNVFNQLSTKDNALIRNIKTVSQPLSTMEKKTPQEGMKTRQKSRKQTSLIHIYDSSKNPFENENQDPTNPFAEYDDNLNPFHDS